MEDDNTRRLNKKHQRQLKVFGISFGSAMLLLLILLYSKHRTLLSFLIPGTLSAYALVCAFVFRPGLRPLRAVIENIGAAIFNCIGFVALFLLYFFVLTPYAWVLKAGGKDQISVTNATPGWNPVDAHANDPNSIEKLY